METTKMNEKESLELIAQMIQQTKQHIAKDWGYGFLLSGYSTAILAIVIYTLIYFTSNPLWNLGWALMVLIFPIIVYVKKNKPEVTTYIDSLVTRVWSVINIMIIFTFFLIMALTLIGWVLPDLSALLISGTTQMPLVILFLGIGVSITGAIIKERMITYFPLIGIAIAVYMLISRDYQNMYLYFGLSLLPIIIIPGHILNHKVRKQC